MGPCGQVQGPRGTHQTGPRALPRLWLLCTPSSSPKKDALIFLELSEAVAAAELLILSEGGLVAREEVVIDGAAAHATAGCAGGTLQGCTVFTIGTVRPLAYAI